MRRNLEHCPHWVNIRKRVTRWFLHSVRTSMSKLAVAKARNWLFALSIACGIFGAYVITVGIVPAIGRHTGDSGRLQWLPSIPGAVRVLNAYAWPMNQLSRVSVMHTVFEFSISCWWTLLDPPDTTP